MSGEELQPHELMQIVADFLEEHAIVYRLVDLIARMACGEPLFTININMVAELKLNHGWDVMLRLMGPIVIFPKNLTCKLNSLFGQIQVKIGKVSIMKCGGALIINCLVSNSRRCNIVSSLIVL